MKFFVESPVTPELCERMARLDSSNPMLTWAYVKAMSALGPEAIIAGLQEAPGGEWTAACPAFFYKGRLRSRVEITSLPVLAEPDVYWSGLLAYLRARGVSTLQIGTFGSKPSPIPSIPVEVERSQRVEFILDLCGRDLMAGMASHHRRIVRKAEQAGIEVGRAKGANSVEEHLRVSHASLDRRHDRGESVGAIEPTFLRSVVSAGAAEMFQATLDGRVLSSIVVLRAARGGYLYSSGTDPEGMKLGASHLLNLQIARALQQENCETYNLGGAGDPASSLGIYKSRFGTRTVALEAAVFDIGPPWKRKLATAVHLARHDRGHLRMALTGTIERFTVFSAAAAGLNAPVWPEHFSFQEISPGDLQVLPMPGDLRAAELARTKRLNGSRIYGVLCDGALVHISWVVRAGQEQPRHLNLKDREAEITACETVPEYRGKGLYPLAIQAIAQEMRGQGVDTLWMKAKPSNAASQKGILKAGLKRCGSTFAYLLPGGRRRIIFRMFRRG